MCVQHAIKSKHIRKTVHMILDICILYLGPWSEVPSLLTGAKYICLNQSKLKNELSWALVLIKLSVSWCAFVLNLVLNTTKVTMLTKQVPGSSRYLHSKPYFAIIDLTSWFTAMKILEDRANIIHFIELGERCRSCWASRSGTND